MAGGSLVMLADRPEEKGMFHERQLSTLFRRLLFTALQVPLPSWILIMGILFNTYAGDHVCRLTCTLTSAVGFFLMYNLWAIYVVWAKANTRTPPPNVGDRSSRKVPHSLKPTALSVRHALWFSVQRLNYLIQAVRAVVYVCSLKLTSQDVVEKDVISMFMCTSLPLYSNIEEGDQAMTIQCYVDKFALPYIEHKFDNVLSITLSDECALRKEDQGIETPFGKLLGVFRRSGKHFDAESLLDGAQVVNFSLNGCRIETHREQLAILATMGATVLHPKAHAYFDELYEYRTHPGFKQYDAFFIHGQYLNETAHMPAPLLQATTGWFEKVLCYNALMPIPVHAVVRLAKLKPYSRMLRFLLPAHSILRRVIREHGAPMHCCEHLFLTSIMHSMDHYCGSQILLGKDLYFETMGFKPMLNLFVMCFYTPNQYIFTNLLKHKIHANHLFADLYKALKELDAELANNVTLSISY